MKLTPLQRRAERRNRNQSMVDMNLVSLIDVFTILIFFLLSNATGVEVLPSPKAVQLPLSMAEKEPRDTIVVVVNNADILVGGRKVANVADVMCSLRFGCSSEKEKIACFFSGNQGAERV